MTYKIGDEFLLYNGLQFLTHYVVGFNEKGEPITSPNKPLIEEPIKEEIVGKVKEEEVMEIKVKKPRKKKAE